MRRSRAFTLIELLIVIAIIAILALIAIPNFLEAQIRAKTSRARTDLRSIATGLEAYMVDHSVYPPNDGEFSVTPIQLSTPIAYISTTNWPDPFVLDIIPHTETVGTATYPVHYQYTYMQIVPESMWNADPKPPDEAIDSAFFNRGAFTKYGFWRMLSKGPDRVYMDPNNFADRPTFGSDVLYDPTNGTMSFGNILRTQRDPNGRVFEPQF